MTIMTDANGRPFECPESPGANADIEAKIAYLRAYAKFRDRVADCANRAFADEFGKAVRMG